MAIANAQTVEYTNRRPFIIDTSGSMSEDSLRGLFAEIRGLDKASLARKNVSLRRKLVQRMRDRKIAANRAQRLARRKMRQAN